jgi:hypothetical protein
MPSDFWSAMVAPGKSFNTGIVTAEVRSLQNSIQVEML